MAISKFNYSSYIARTKRHYNLNVDDFIVVDEAARMLASSVYHCEFIAIAVTAEKFEELKKYPLADCDVKNHIRLLEGVFCRRQQLPEVEAKKWNGNCWSLTREYLKQTLEAELLGPKTTAYRQTQINRELDLLSVMNPDVPITSNSGRAQKRIASAILYMGISKDDITVMDQTIGALTDDIKPDNSIIVIGVEAKQFAKVKQAVTIPNSVDFHSGAKIYSGFEIEPNTYVVPVSKKVYEATTAAKGPYYDKAMGMTYLRLKYL